jgi:hypothetical protein
MLSGTSEPYRSRQTSAESIGHGNSWSETDINIEIESLERAKHRRVTAVFSRLRSKGYQTVTEFVKSRSTTPKRLPDFVEPMKAKLVGSKAEKKDGNSISEDGTLNEWISESEP